MPAKRGWIESESTASKVSVVASRKLLPVVDLDPHPGIGEDRVMDVVEVAIGGREHRRTDLDDADRGHRVTRDRVRRAAAAEADVDDARARALAQEKRQVPLHLLHGVEIGARAGDVDAVQLQREIGAGGVGLVADGHRGARVLVEVDQGARTVRAEDAGGEDDAIRRQDEGETQEEHRRRESEAAQAPSARRRPRPTGARTSSHQRRRRRRPRAARSGCRGAE